MIKMKRGFIWMFILTVTLSGILFGVRYAKSASAEEDKEISDNLRLFTEVLAIVRKNYVGDIKIKDFIYGAIKGGINAIDPNSFFLTPEKYKDTKTAAKENLGTIGIQMRMKDGMLTVISTIDDTPAHVAGIKSGDKIVKINGEPTGDMSLHDALGKMSGAPKTAITLTVFRKGWLEAKDFTLMSEAPNIKSVKSRIIEERIGYVRITQFQEHTATDLSDTMEKLIQEKINAIILDLRDNPGGLLNSAVDIAGQFLTPDKLVVYAIDKKGEKNRFLTKEVKPNYIMPMVILVNQGSAGSSEIVAGALQKWDRAVILGTHTFGRGTIQTVVPLRDGSALRLTTARYFTPKGVSIEDSGIIPDLMVEPGEKGDIQLQSAIALLKK